MKSDDDHAPFISRSSDSWCTAPKLFAAAFLGTCVIALFIQLVLLPQYFPHLHAGHGLLIGGDSAGMHQTAAELAEAMRFVGWKAWELRPFGNAPTGIAAILYRFTVSEPYVLVPLNAAVHAGGGLVIFLIVLHITQHRVAALAGALPFLLFPSAAIWYAQIHKDGIFALGMLLCALGWMQAFRRDFWLTPVPRFAALLVPIALGLFLIWVVRPHIMVLMQAVAIVTTVFGLGIVAACWHGRVIEGGRALIAVLALLAIPVLMILAKPSDDRVESWRGSVDERESVMHYMPTSCVIPRGASASVDKLPTTVAAMRDFYISGYRTAKSNMDPEFVPGTLCDLLVYLPRALQIGFLAPFPSAWMDEGSIAASTVMRRVISIETLAVYACLLLLPLAMWNYRRKPEFWFVLGFLTLLTMIHVYLVPNLGTLHRMRYGFLTAVVGVALAGAMDRLLATWPAFGFLQKRAAH